MASFNIIELVNNYILNLDEMLDCNKLNNKEEETKRFFISFFISFILHCTCFSILLLKNYLLKVFYFK